VKCREGKSLSSCDTAAFEYYQRNIHKIGRELEETCSTIIKQGVYIEEIDVLWLLIITQFWLVNLIVNCSCYRCNFYFG
jgi:hypothetical protein